MVLKVLSPCCFRGLDAQAFLSSECMYAGARERGRDRDRDREFSPEIPLMHGSLSPPPGRQPPPALSPLLFILGYWADRMTIRKSDLFGLMLFLYLKCSSKLKIELSERGSFKPLWGLNLCLRWDKNKNKHLFLYQVLT